MLIKSILCFGFYHYPLSCQRAPPEQPGSLAFLPPICDSYTLTRCRCAFSSPGQAPPALPQLSPPSCRAEPCSDLLLQPRVPLAFLATRVHRWVMANSLSTRTSKPSAGRLGSWWAPAGTGGRMRSSTEQIPPLAPCALVWVVLGKLQPERLQHFSWKKRATAGLLSLASC